MIVVTLYHMYLNVFKIEPKDEEIRLFSTMEKAELWLKENDFYYGQRDFLNYKDNAKEWVHKKDVVWEYIYVDIIEYDIDVMNDYRYRSFIPSTAPWFQ